MRPRQAATRGSRQRRPARPSAVGTWLLRHLQAAFSSLGRLSRAPLSALMTAGVIGIALALPAGLHVLLENVQQLSGRWDNAATISLFLKLDVNQEHAEDFAQELRSRPGIASVQLIGRDQALEEFRRLSGFGDALEALNENPLPIVLVVEPSGTQATPEGAEVLAAELKARNEVEIAQIDLQWVRRFQAITEIVSRGVLVIASLLALAVLLIVGNTIRLEIQNRHAEIEITKLIGGTDAFIRRPFLYSGLWYGLLGGWVAWVLVTVSLTLLAEPAEHLAVLYHSGFGLSSVDLATVLTLMAGGASLGLGGSWIAVGRHLSEIEPG